MNKHFNIRKTFKENSCICNGTSLVSKSKKPINLDQILQIIKDETLGWYPYKPYKDKANG